MFSSCEVVQRAIRFQGIDRLPRQFPALFRTTLPCWLPIPISTAICEGTDEWGSVWHCLENTTLGQVKEFSSADLGRPGSSRHPRSGRPQTLAGLGRRLRHEPQ